MLLALQLYSVQGFPLYKDTDLGRATAYQLYRFEIEVGFGANAAAAASLKLLRYFAQNPPKSTDFHHISVNIEEEKKLYSPISGEIFWLCPPLVQKLELHW